MGGRAGEEERGEKEPNGRRKLERGKQRGDVTRRHNCISCSPIGGLNINMWMWSSAHYCTYSRVDAEDQGFSGANY